MVVFIEEKLLFSKKLKPLGFYIVFIGKESVSLYISSKIKSSSNIFMLIPFSNSKFIFLEGNNFSDVFPI